MKYKLTLRKEAEFDIEEQFEFFEEKRLGLGHDFLLCVEEALDKLQKNPLIYRKIYKELRRTSITRFPLRVFYLVQNQNIIVTAVLHAKKDPTSWRNRT
ncbi:type II toxin-antitoxin system RelE/ParE family toxin [Methylicorpusculum sp.]|jgi:plasmid stabilization system protein ParE|uniref:type II toxin-antitoxin system RelE/ParE family toxin n=1 Tax=Methylicorpusculum sp. TaxID=2713644 RepID=UPI00272843DF|nr:type II toxin-antitoxin system RelE/ParE family toxin [Methylicorpusculum sp.]MDO8844616.1 type II toxin-antitoxin system RelE/ParE family toxin [Methylicorpusculum sp.]